MPHPPADDDMRIDGRRSALAVVLATLGAKSPEQRRLRARACAAAVDQLLQAESTARRVHPEWAKGLEDIAQALLRIADEQG